MRARGGLGAIGLTGGAGMRELGGGAAVGDLPAKPRVFFAGCTLTSGVFRTCASAVGRCTPGRFGSTSGGRGPGVAPAVCGRAAARTGPELTGFFDLPPEPRSTALSGKERLPPVALEVCFCDFLLAIQYESYDIAPVGGRLTTFDAQTLFPRTGALQTENVPA